MTARLTSAQRSLIEANHGLAERISHDFLVSAPGLDREELVAVSYQGLVTAALRYDASTGVPFGAWASKMIKFEVLMWQRSEDYLGRGVRSDFKKLVKAGLNTPERPSMALLVERTGLRARRISTVIRAEASKPFSSDNLSPFTSGTSGDSAPDGTEIAGIENVESSALVGIMQGSVATVVQNLPMLQKVVLAKHYMEGLELRVIAEQLECSVSAVRQAHSDAVIAVHEEMMRQARQHD